MKRAWRSAFGLATSLLSVARARGRGWPFRIGRPRRAFTLIELMAVVIVIGALIGIAMPRLRFALEQARVAKAVGDIQALQIELESLDSLPPSLTDINRNGYLDPWGRPYVYYLFPDSKGKGPPSGARRDKFLVPVNSQYDLYSIGKDGATTMAFTAKSAHDDVVRASDGGFIGLAAKF